MTVTAVPAQQLLEDRAGKEPDRVAYVFAERKVTYREYQERSNQVAVLLRAKGVVRGTPVGLSVRRGVELPWFIFGVLKAGGVCVPLEPDYPADRVREMCKAIGLEYVISDDDLAGRFADIGATVVSPSELDGKETNTPESVNEVHDTAFMLFTSGSTGAPKVVERTHSNITVPHLLAAAESEDNRGCIPLRAPMSHSPFVWDLFAPLASGYDLVVVPHGEEKDDLKTIDLIKTHKITHLSLSPANLGSLLQSEAFADCSSLVSVDCSGEPLPQGVRSKFLGQCSAELTSTYGCTETPGVTTYQYRLDEDGSSHILGVPAKHVRFHLLDGDRRPVADGDVGEIYLGGPQLAKGYYNGPSQTEERFIHWADGTGESLRLFRTGDLGRRLPDGRYEYLGRNDHQVQIRGFRVELVEIESALDALSWVEESAVVLYKNGENQFLTAYLVLGSEEDYRLREVREYLGSRLPDYMVPSRYVILQSLPRNANGKVDRKRLPAPDDNRPVWEEARVPPQTALQKTLVAAWEEILKLSPLGITDHFFQWGGTSLSAVRLLGVIRQKTGRQLPLDSLNIHPTVESLSRYLEESGERESHLVTLCKAESKIPFFWIHGSRAMVTLPVVFGNTQTLYALTDHSQSGRVPKEKSVEEFAASYVKDILSVQPDGPYRIGGYCSGSLFAVEIARQLRELGKEVRLLFIVEPARRLVQTSVKSASSEESEQQSGWHRLRRLPWHKKIGFVTERIQWHLVQKIGLSRSLLCRLYAMVGKPIPLRLRRYYIINVVYGKAFSRYQPKPFQGTVRLYYSGSEHYGGSLDWSRITTETVEAVSISGANHMNILEEPFAREWTDALRVCLESEDGGESGDS